MFYEIRSILSIHFGEAFRVLNKWWVLDYLDAKRAIELNDKLDFPTYPDSVPIDLEWVVGIIQDKNGNAVKAVVYRD